MERRNILGGGKKRVCRISRCKEEAWEDTEEECSTRRDEEIMKGVKDGTEWIKIETELGTEVAPPP